jgi:CheY-like chemotaxis protein
VSAAIPDTHLGRVLLVEDHENLARLLSLSLRTGGYYVQTAGSVAAARELVEQSEFDVLISDLGLPDGSGLELMRDLRRRSAIKGIAYSGRGLEEDFRASFEAGFAEHLVKPIEVEQLQEALARVLGNGGRAQSAAV